MQCDIIPEGISLALVGAQQGCSGVASLLAVLKGLSAASEYFQHGLHAAQSHSACLAHLAWGNARCRYCFQHP